jgi:RNA polymerase sigma-70 factor (sigma-E family)
MYAEASRAGSTVLPRSEVEGVEVTGQDAGSGTTSRGAPREARRDAEFADYMAARQPGLLRTAYLLSGDRHTAEDLVQTALAKLYLSWDKVQRRESIDGYVRRILVNEHNSLWRRAWKRQETTVSQFPDRPAAEAPAGRDADLWAFVQTLPRRQRAVVVLRFYEELTEAETAAALGVSVGTVKSQTSRALAALRSRSGELDIQETR